MRVRHTIGRLAEDYDDIPVRAVVDMVNIVEDNAKFGRDLARASAFITAGQAGKHYHKAITHERLAPLVAEYGPDIAMPQGGMKFEFGEGRQTSPHLDLAKSADVIPSSTAGDLRRAVTRWFRS